MNAQGTEKICVIVIYILREQYYFLLFAQKQKDFGETKETTKKVWI